MWGRKKKDQQEETPEEIKDITPRRRKKKDEKEEKKPWGKGERYLLLFLLTITVLGSSILALMARSWKLPGLPRVRLPEEAFDIWLHHFS